MFQRKSLNLKIYFGYSLPILLGLWLFLPAMSEKNAILIAYLAIVLSQLALVYGMRMLFNNMTSSRGGGSFWIVVLFLLKSGILIGGFYCGVQLVRDGIVIPLIFYIYMLVLLGISLKKTG